MKHLFREDLAIRQVPGASDIFEWNFVRIINDNFLSVSI